ncbi:MAG: RagB/SusD family nutrient uptake outer membrane protein [Paludibacteraceae bacterium]|nr:RagB/SusD family nutrient uptake outer membrane protein [Paludibacteraceae bacterium]
MKKTLIILATVTLTLASCGDSFLTREYAGGQISQDVFDKLPASKLEGTLQGLYSMIYSNGSSSHDVFGQRSIDLWGDICCGDIAVTNKTYGWLYTDECMQTYGRTGYVWGFYYDIIHNANTVIRSIEASSKIQELVGQYGWPSEANPEHEYTDDEITYAIYLAQALALRGYCYSNLARWYTPVEDNEYMGGAGKNIETFECAPIYTESNMDQTQPLAMSSAVYDQGISDLTKSVQYFEEFGKNFTRSSKLIIDLDVANGLLAYACLNCAPYYVNYDDGGVKAKEYWQKAFDNAKAVIDRGNYPMLSQKELYTTGFNEVKTACWMWGQDVVTETASGLKSWFGQMDIHSYSYSWAGDTKVIDANLRDQMPDWDGRKLWFNDGKEKSAFVDCPDGKFYSAQNPTSTAAEDLDREWLSDNIFMRVDVMYLIAAEAAYFLDQYPTSINYLTTLTDQRMNPKYPLSAEDYAEYKTSLSNSEELLKQIIYNWRIEMWGEGYGYQTFRRLTKKIARGSNHQVGGDAEANKAQFNMNIPSSETTYNPYIKH